MMTSSGMNAYFFNYSDNTLLKWLETLATYGIAKIIAAPLECGQLSVLAKRISYIRKTQYGYVKQ